MYMQDFKLALETYVFREHKTLDGHSIVHFLPSQPYDFGIQKLFASHSRDHIIVHTVLSVLATSSMRGSGAQRG